MGLEWVLKWVLKKSVSRISPADSKLSAPWLGAVATRSPEEAVELATQAGLYSWNSDRLLR
jgi:hypothetical protein